MNEDVSNQDSELLDPEIVGAFLDESDEALEANPDEHEGLHSVFRAFHSIKGNSAFFGFMSVKLLAHRLEDVLALMRDGKLVATKPVMNGLLAGVDQLKAMLARIREQESECPEDAAAKLAELTETLTSLCVPDAQQTADLWPGVLKQFDELISVLANDADLGEVITRLHGDLLRLAPAKHAALTETAELTAIESSPAESVEAKLSAAQPSSGTEQAAPSSTKQAAPAQKQASGDAAHRTMRVEEKKIDEFLDYVGELIMVREMFANVGKTLRSETTLTHVSAEYQRALEAFTSLSLDLQHSIMEVRKISVRAILQKVPRAVRDLATTTGKEAQVELVGTDIAVDKSLVEGFEAPIMHMVRNSLDHGVELPDERERKGKPRCGAIAVTVSEGADEVVFTIVDDGAGIDQDALRDKAVSSGILTASAAKKLSRSQTFDLLFAPGLSTAKKITEVSGRGVGMDVVKRNVEELSGRIVIESEKGIGSTFRGYLPKAVTVQILDGFLVQVGKERFVLPLQNINESFRPAKEEIHTVAESGECITRRGRVFPLVRFGRLLKLPGSADSPCDAIVVSIGLKDGAVAGLMVDDVLGTQQVVLRDVDGIDTSGVPFSGGAVLGDGRVAMVLDVDRLAALVM